MHEIRPGPMWEPGYVTEVMGPQSVEWGSVVALAPESAALSSRGR